MKLLIVAVALIFGFLYAAPSTGSCNICVMISKTAEGYFNGTSYTNATEVEDYCSRYCYALYHELAPAAGVICYGILQQDFSQLLSSWKAGKTPEQSCTDVGLCV